MKKQIIFFLLLALGIGKAGAQFDYNKVTIGGGLGLQFGNYTVINIAPQIGYNFTDYLNAGAGVNYTYFKDKFDTGKQTNDYVGLNLYAHVYPIPNIVLKVQPEINYMWQSIEYKATGYKTTHEEAVPVFLIGGGVRFGPVTAMILYDVVQNSNSPYGNSVFYSVGYSFNF